MTVDGVTGGTLSGRTMTLVPLTSVMVTLAPVSMTTSASVSAPHTSTVHGDPALSVGVVRIDLACDDRREADQPGRTHTGCDGVLVDPTPGIAVHHVPEESAADEEDRPLDLDREVVEADDRCGEGRHGERQDDERAGQQDQFDEGEDDTEPQPHPRPDVQVDAEIEHFVTLDGPPPPLVGRAPRQSIDLGRRGAANPDRLVGCGQTTTGLAVEAPPVQGADELVDRPSATISPNASRSALRWGQRRCTM